MGSGSQAMGSDRSLHFNLGSENNFGTMDRDIGILGSWIKHFRLKFHPETRSNNHGRRKQNYGVNISVFSF